MSTTPDERLLDDRDHARLLGAILARKDYSEAMDAIDRDRAARIEEAAALRAEVEALKATNTALNRRCQSAESGLAHLDKGPGSTSLGRALANSAATMYAAKLAEAMGELAQWHAIGAPSHGEPRGDGPFTCPACRMLAAYDGAAP